MTAPRERIPPSEGSYWLAPPTETLGISSLSLKAPTAWYDFSTASRDLLGRLYTCNGIHRWPWHRRLLERLGFHRSDTVVGPLFSRWPKKTKGGVLFDGRACLKTREARRF